MTAKLIPSSKGSVFCCLLVQFVAIGVISVAREAEGADTSKADAESICKKANCDFYSRCVVVNGAARCDCPMGCFQNKPVCGNNNKTYSSECALKMQSCLKKIRITVRHEGHCGMGACAKVHCKYYGTCQVDKNNNASCVCLTKCPTYYKPVCGSDGKTYSNECGMQLKSCKEKREIVKKYDESCERDGLCPKVSSEGCRIRKQICDHDEQCPGNRKCCPTASCTTNCTKPWPDRCPQCYKIGKYCQFSGDTNSTVHCTACPVWCPLDKVKPKCGSNGVTYPDMCHFDLARCTTDNKLRIVHNGSCRQMKKKKSLIIGLSVGITALVIFLLCVAGYLYYRRKRTKEETVLQEPFIDKSGDDL